MVKHLPAGSTVEELRDVFERYGTVGRLLLPPSGLTAIVEYLEPAEARVGFCNLAYTKVLKGSYIISMFNFSSIIAYVCNSNVVI